MAARQARLAVSGRRDRRPGGGDGERLAEGDVGGLDGGHLAGRDEGRHHRKCGFRRQVGDSDRAGKGLAVEEGRVGGGKERVWGACLSTHSPVPADATVILYHEAIAPLAAVSSRLRETARVSCPHDRLVRIPATPAPSKMKRAGAPAKKRFRDCCSGVDR